MPIPMPDQTGTPAGDVVHRQIDGSEATLFLNALRQAAVDAGWSAAGLGARNYLPFATTNPTAAQTVTLNGLAYTFRTSINNGVAREVLIGASAAVSYRRLVNCVLDNGVGKGTEYSNATTANPYFRAFLNSAETEFWVEALTGGPDSNSLTVAEAVTPNWSIGSTTNPLYGGYRLLSDRTPQGLQVACEFRRYSSTEVTFCVGDKLQADSFGVTSSNTRWATPYRSVSKAIAMASGRLFKVIAHRYHLWFYVPGSNATQTACCAFVTQHPSQLEAPVVSSATGGGGTLVQITTDRPHGMTATGNVYIWGAEGLGINGFWNVTVTGPDGYTLDGSQAVAAGSYTSGSARAADVNAGQISFAVGGWQHVRASTGFRYRALGQNQSRWIQGVNQYFWTDEDLNKTGRMFVPGINSLKWVGDRYFFQESPIAFGTDQDASAWYTVGWLWAAAIAGRYTPVDSLAVDSSGQQWFEFSTEQSGSGLWLAVPLTEN
jgi:hypothetical protein